LRASLCIQAAVVTALSARFAAIFGWPIDLQVSELLSEAEKRSLCPSGAFQLSVRMCARAQERVIMRVHSIASFVLLGLVSFGHVDAQTWEQPDGLWWYGNYSASTCGAPNTIETFDGYGSNGSPDVVYKLPYVIPRGMTPGPEFLTLYPNNGYQNVDFEVFVCGYKSGYNVWDCPIEADNVYSTGSPVQLTIPREDQAFRIIVTSGMLNYGNCGAYTLVTSH
jgi:hypothetical protein